MTKLEPLYIATASLLVGHQIDSAYWHEWTLFGIPGGIQVFVLLNLPLVLIVLYGLIQVVRSPRRGARFALGLAVVGVAAFFIHLVFAWRGHPEFRNLTSWAILSATLLSSLGLGWKSSEIMRTRTPD
jgi:hypothetical protein